MTVIKGTATYCALNSQILPTIDCCADSYKVLRSRLGTDGLQRYTIDAGYELIWRELEAAQGNHQS